MMLRRAVDVVASIIALTLTAPIFLLTAVAILTSDPGPVFYRQSRAGLHGKAFQLLKFRSMRTNNRPLNTFEEIGEKHPLVFPLGGWIRRFKVDELPQLINVLRGDMSLIGPRPTVLDQVEGYTGFQRRRLEVLPGMTGWVQVNGGTELTWPERIVLEVWYVDHRSLKVDAEVLLKTFSVILFGYRLNPRAFEQALRSARAQADDIAIGLVPAPVMTHE